MTLDRGTLLNNRYRIMEILGQGGMASIYRAVDENLGVDVAVKENLFTTEEYARQFRLEAVILANLRHANMPRVTDHFVIEDEGQYLVMDYIEGEDLRQRLDRQGPVQEEEAIILGVAICDALSYLHTRTPAVLHRDVKPGNVKITPTGQIFLVDFGLAKVVQRGQATTTGARAMTPGYSPPEQYGTARTDHRTDVYSLGATLYSALTDALPEDGLARAMDQATLTSIRQRNPKVSRRLASAIEKALEVRPDNRYQSAEEFKQCLLSARSTTRQKMPVDLVLTPPPPEYVEVGHRGTDPDREPPANDEQAMPELSGINRPSSPRPAANKGNVRRSTFRYVLWFTALLTVIATALVWTDYTNPGFAWRAMAWLAPGFETTPTQTSTATLAPTQAAATATQTAIVQNTLVPSRTVISTRTPLPTRSITPTLAPTPVGGGAQIAFASDRTGIPEVYLLDLASGSEKQITYIAEGACQPDWSPDGEWLVFVSPCKGDSESYQGSSLFVIRNDGEELHSLPSVPGGDFDPDWSPDGKKIAFTSLRTNDYPQIFILDVQTNEVTSLADAEGKANSQPAWSPDGKRIAFIGPRGQVWSMDVDGGNRFILSRATQDDAVNRMPGWSSDGLTVVFTQWRAGMSGAPWLAKVQSEQGSLVIVIAKDAPMAEAQYSPDGFWLVFHSWPTSSNQDLYIMDPAGINRQQITDDPANEFDPVWRP